MTPRELAAALALFAPLEKPMENARIASAFVKAQMAFGPALKTSKNPHFKSSYADLATVVEAVVDALHANGIAVMQRNHACDDGVSIETVFIHESGEQLSSGILTVPAAKQDPQGYGSAQTYARRYSLMAACGIAPEDDDGNAAKPPQKRGQSTLAAAAEDNPIPADEKPYLDELAMDMSEAFQKDGAEAAYALMADKELETGHKLYLSLRLTPTVRNAVKKVSMERRAVPA